MRKNLKSLSLLVFGLLISAKGYSQNAEMATVMRENGKIYVVVAVLVTIFIGITIYLINLDNRLKKLEREKVNKPHSK